MAFPTVATSATSKETVYGTSDFVVTLPTGVASGDLLLLYIIYNVAADRTYVTPSGWTRVARLFGNSAFESYIYGRFATGAESTATFTKTREAGGTGGGAGAAIAYRITGHYSSGTVADAVEATLAGSFANPTNPQALNPTGWDAEDTLWFAGVGCSETYSVSSYPTNYSSNQLTVVEAGATHRATMASYASNTASEDPGAYTFTGPPDYGHVVTIGVRPAGGGGGSSSVPLKLQLLMGA